MKILLPIFVVCYLLLFAPVAGATTATIGNNTGDTYAGSNALSIFLVSPTSNQSAALTFEVSKYGDGATDHGHALIKFSGLSSISGPVTVSSATIHIWQETAGGGNTYSVDARRLLRNWVYAQATWNEYSTGNAWTTPGALSAGNDRSATISATGSITGTTGTYFSITGAQLATDVQNMINGSVSNFGWHLERSDAGDDATYKQFTNEQGTDGHRPYLEVIYTAGGGGIVRRRIVIVQ